MKKFSLLLIIHFYGAIVMGQPVSSQLDLAIKKFEADNQMKHAITGFFVIDAKTGKTIFARNEMTGMAPASTQKIVTAAAAFELLGKDYTYSTGFGVLGNTNASGEMSGDLYIQAGGDPTLGSWRWQNTHEKQLYSDWSAAFESQGISSFSSNSTIKIIARGFRKNSFPDGWIWQDIGNYYGARHAALNWRENQFDIHFNPGSSVGAKVETVRINPEYAGVIIDPSDLKTGPARSGDQAYVYLNPEKNNSMLVAGTIPLGERNFSISAAHPKPAAFFSGYLNVSAGQGFKFPRNIEYVSTEEIPQNIKIIYTHKSPSLDSIIYWFLRKSINLYGEALLKTIAIEHSPPNNDGTTVISSLFTSSGVNAAELHMLDGSGLSPQNRITPHALVKILQYSKSRPWYNSFYHSLPVINGMKMKSGSISGARAYAGYHTSKNGSQYIFAIIVNNYDGSAGTVTRKIFDVLNLLK